MRTTVLALLPATAVGAYVFGYRALVTVAISMATCVAFEALVQKLRRVKVTVSDGSAAVTGLLLALVLPPDVRWYVPVVGGLVAIGVGKQAFGGLGANFFNPALVGRAFLQFAFPAQVSLAKWPILAGPGMTGWARLVGDVRDAAGDSADAVTRATPLALLKDNPGLEWSAIEGASPFGAPLVWLLPTAAAAALFAVLVAGALAGLWLAWRKEMRAAGVAGVGALLLFGVVPTGNVSFGQVPGCIGETSAWAILLGGLSLIHYRYIRWELPAVYVGTVALLALAIPMRAGDAWAGGLAGPFMPERVLAHVFGGGLFLGGFFMLTDMVTRPLTLKGQLICGAAAGVLVVVIRFFAGYPEGVCYSILLANAARPLIDRYTGPRTFGAGRGGKA
jgi:electron transport complex protein RnfD